MTDEIPEPGTEVTVQWDSRSWTGTVQTTPDYVRDEGGVRVSNPNGTTVTVPRKRVTEN